MIAFILSNENGNLKCKFVLFGDRKWRSRDPNLRIPGL